ncbi:MAG: hypothetical protein IRY90_12185, partial [Actinomadura rubrobrunea]|nr:hypothetical protein [Actinomadura rubrobrunea]
MHQGKRLAVTAGATVLGIVAMSGVSHAETDRAPAPHADSTSKPALNGTLVPRHADTGASAVTNHVPIKKPLLAAAKTAKTTKAATTTASGERAGTAKTVKAAKTAKTAKAGQAGSAARSNDTAAATGGAPLLDLRLKASLTHDERTGTAGAGLE